MRWVPTLEELLLQLGLGDLNLDRLVDLLLVSSLVVGIVLDGGGEKRVDEGGLSQPGFTSNLSAVSSSSVGVSQHVGIGLGASWYIP